ncbi:hypothetical protein ASG49_00870 [Marmoricola sp. Leaf446]|uniref:hypothetical protein n=1 Tax=Marmoricola sp. Leaf446 TaxID=1736379 RepID=UPI000701AA97|nr:hypothetical protein [Marmoricola sp. Leaf446]KQT93589.1 hypothetical protein ASG49_00870 [Marmoricola sp. Leaf446]
MSVAVALLGTATALVLLSLPTRSVLWLSLASVSSLVLSWAALRIVWTEVLQSRRENAADRAAAARAYRELFTVRAAEHAEFTTAMTERLAEARLSQRELEGLLALQQGRTTAAESVAAQRQAEQEERLQQLRGRVAELEEAAAAIAATEAAAAARPVDEDALRAWETRSPDSVVELAAWEENLRDTMRAAGRSRRQA